MRHPLEWPAYILAVVLIPVVLANGYLFYDGFKTAMILFGGFAVLVIFFREIPRRAAHGNAVALSRSQFPEIYQIVDDLSKKLGLNRVPDVYLTTGEGELSASATESWGKSYIVLNSELFSDQGDSIKAGLAFLIGHELGHIKLKHTSVLYTIPLVPWMWLNTVPFFGQAFALPYNVLNRLREYSCDRIAAQLVPDGINGLLLLAAGRYVYERVDLQSFLEQADSWEMRGPWTGIAESFNAQPFVANRVRTLYKLGFFGGQRVDNESEGLEREPNGRYAGERTPASR